MRDNPRVRSASKRLLALLVGFVMALGLAEVGFRVAGIRPPQPDGQDKGQMHWSREKHGPYHDYPWQLEKPAGVHRVIALGDSFTMGRKVPLDEIFVKRVERSLNEQVGRKAYEIYNLAVPGWDTRNELIALERQGLRYDPDAVVVFFFINDATGMDSNPEVIHRMHALIYERDGWLNDVSALYDWVDYFLRKRRVSRETIADYRASFFGPEADRKQWEESKRALAKMRDLARERGFPLGLVIFPMLVRLDEDHELSDVYAQVEEYCAELGIPTLNLLPAFYGYEPSELWVSPTNAHPNSFANGLAAGPIEEFLIREGLVPDPNKGG